MSSPGHQLTHGQSHGRWSKRIGGQSTKAMENSSILGRMISAAAGGIPAETHAKDVEKFFKVHPAPTATDDIKRTLEGIRAPGEVPRAQRESAEGLFRSSRRSAVDRRDCPYRKPGPLTHDAGREEIFPVGSCVVAKNDISSIFAWRGVRVGSGGAARSSICSACRRYISMMPTSNDAVHRSLRAACAQGSERPCRGVLAPARPEIPRVPYRPAPPNAARSADCGSHSQDPRFAAPRRHHSNRRRARRPYRVPWRAPRRGEPPSARHRPGGRPAQCKGSAPFRSWRLRPLRPPRR